MANATIPDIYVTLSNDNMGIVEGTEREIYVLWTLTDKFYRDHANHIKDYKLEWFYFTGNTTAKTGTNIWLAGSTTTVEFQKTVDPQGKYYQTATYTPPDNAVLVKVRITPESKDLEKEVKNKTETKGKHFNGKSRSASLNLIDILEPEPVTPAVPSTPEVTITGTTLLAEVTNYNDENGKYIQFQVIKNNKTVIGDDKIVKIKYGRAAVKLEIAIGGQYKVRARASALSGQPDYNPDPDPLDYIPGLTIAEYAARAKAYAQAAANMSAAAANQAKIDFENPAYTSNWSDFSDNEGTIPADVDEKKVTVKAKTFGNLSGVKVDWARANNAHSYEVEYTTDPDFFDSSPGNVQSVEVIGVTEAEITGLDSGNTWYFRVRAKNEDGDASAWTKTYPSIKIGTTPTAPTTWTITSTIKVGTNPTIYWTHNCEDGSEQSDVQVRVKVDNYDWMTLYPEDNKANHFTIDILSSYWTLPIEDGTKIKWQVRTKGLVDTFSPWSATKTIEVYSPPQVECHLSYGNNLGDDTQSPFEMGYYPLVIELEALPANRTVVSFSVSITSNKEYTDLDEVGNVITIRAGQEIYRRTFNHAKNQNNYGKLSLGPGDINLLSSINNEYTYTITATAAMSSGLTAKTTRTFVLDYTVEEQFYYCSAMVTLNSNLTADIVPVAMDEFDNPKQSKYLKLSVYRREYNGQFTLIADDITTEKYPVVVTDPHPSLHYMSYRIVAISTRTGAVSYNDTQAIPVLHSAIVIQWDEEWQIYYGDNNIMDLTADTGSMDIQTWQGSILQLPYNVDITAEQKNDVELVGYIGREHPVSYYGTQKSETGHWKADIPKRDTETLYLLRRLANYMGDVYVREPSGIGYWAHVDVSYNIDHVKTVVPVTLTITRVEGGA